MTAVILENKRMRIPPIPEFPIPPRYIPVILSAIAPAKRFDYPAECDDLWARGEIEITTKEMQRSNIRFCDGGENPVYFTVNGVRCMRGGVFQPTLVNQQGEGEKWSDQSSILYQILRDIHEQEVYGSIRLEKSIRGLNESIGREPPDVL
jgi:hypothetical protein